MGEGLSSSPLSPEYCPFRPASLPTRGDTHILPSASDSNHKLTLIFITLLGNVWSDNRDFAFILYAWLGYCCFSPLPWFPPFPGIRPDFACNTGCRCAPEPRVNNWCILRHLCTFEQVGSQSRESEEVVMEETGAFYGFILPRRGFAKNWGEICVMVFECPQLQHWWCCWGWSSDRHC